MSDRSRETLILGVATVIVVAAVLAGLVRFNARTAPIFAQRAHPVLHLVALKLAGAPASETPGMVPDNNPPPIAAAAWSARVFGRDYRGIMASQVLGFALWVLAFGVFGALWVDRTTGFFCAVAAAVTPLGHFAALGFDDHLFNLLVVVVAASFIVAPSAGRRVWPVAVAGLLAGLTLRWAFVPSNGLLAVAAVGSILAGACVEDGLTSTARRRGRWWATSAALAGLFVAAVAIGAMREGAWRYLAAGYYSEEVGNAPFHSVLAWLTAFSTYPYLLFQYHWGAPLTVAVLAALVAMHRDRLPGRYGIIAWLALSLAALTLIPKKHQWYFLYAAQAAVPLAGWYWASLWSRRKALALAWVAVCLAATTYDLARPSPRWLQVAFLDVSVAESGRPFVAPLIVATRVEAEADAISAFAREPRGVGPRAIVALDWAGPLEELRYFFALKDPSLRLYVIDAARTPPPTEAPFLLYARRPGEDNVPTLAELIDRSIRHVEERVADGAETLGRLDYLLNLRAGAGEAAIVHAGEAFVLFDPSP